MAEGEHLPSQVAHLRVYYLNPSMTMKFITVDMLQSLLQPRENQRPKMIGAMPAVAVRHDRRRGEKRGAGRRPSQLPLQMGRTADVELSPSTERYYRVMEELNQCGKGAVLYMIVGSLLMGIVLLIVGLVQLSPRAEAAEHRYYLMGAGAIFLGIGTLCALLRCVCRHWIVPICDRVEDDEPEPHSHKNVVSVVDGLEKPKLKSQPSVGKEVDSLVKQSSAVSDT